MTSCLNFGRPQCWDLHAFPFLGCPISWHKNALDLWLGYQVDINRGMAWLRKKKLHKLHQCSQVVSLLGLLQWVAKAFPTLSPHLQPLLGTETSSKMQTGQLIHFLAKLALTMVPGPRMDWWMDATAAVMLGNPQPEQP